MAGDTGEDIFLAVQVVTGGVPAFSGRLARRGQSRGVGLILDIHV